MKFCLEAQVLNLTSNVKQFMTELNHSTGCTFNMKSRRANAVTAVTNMAFNIPLG